MSIFKIISSLLSDEDKTTEILVYALKGSESLRNKFLELTGMSGETVFPEDIKTQVQDSDAQARPDICIETKNAILYVENKPWISSFFTEGSSDKPDQIKRYADKLVKEHSRKDKRILTLLTLQQTRGEQLKTIAEVEKLPDISEDTNQLYETLKDYYKKNGVTFFTLTWRKLFDTFRDQCNDKESDAHSYKAFLDSLNEDISDPEHFEKIENNIDGFHSQYGVLERKVLKANDLLKKRPKPFSQPDLFLVPPHCNPKSFSAKDGRWRAFLKYEVLPQWGMFHWGVSTLAYPELTGKKHKDLSHPFIFCVELIKTYVNKPYGVLRQNARVPLFQFGDTKAEEYLEEKGFTRIEGGEYRYFVKPLNLNVNHFLQINPEKVADAVIERANEYAEICKEFIHADDWKNPDENPDVS